MEKETIILGGENAPVSRFQEGHNDAFEIASLEDLTPDALAKFIRLHQEEQRPRLEELRDYYKAQNKTIISRAARKPNLSDKRFSHAYARYVSTFIQGYLVGNPIKVQHDDRKIHAAVQDLNKAIDADRLNADIALDLSIYGRAYDMVHRNKADQDRVYRLSPMGVFVIYDDTVEEIPLAGVRYRENALDGSLEADLYTAQQIRHFTQQGETLIEDETQRREHFFKEVPITEYSNNRFRQGDFEPVLDIIDAYDEAQSDTGNYMTDLNDAMLVISGDINLDIEGAERMRNSNILLLIPVKDMDGKPVMLPTANYIYKEYDVTGVEAYKKRLQNDIHRFTNTPDMTDEKFSGSASGESMKYKLFGLDQVRADKETRMITGLTRRYRLLFNLKSTAQELIGAHADDLAFIFTPNVPRAFYEELKAFTEAGGQLSQETLLTLTALVDNARDEIAKIEKETEARLTPMFPGEDPLNSRSMIQAQAAPAAAPAEEAPEPQWGNLPRSPK